MEKQNIFTIKNIRYNILKFLIKPICQNCLENETKNTKTKYCDWCGYNIYFNIKTPPTNCSVKIKYINI